MMRRLQDIRLARRSRPRTGRRRDRLGDYGPAGVVAAALSVSALLIAPASASAGPVGDILHVIATPFTALAGAASSLAASAAVQAFVDILNALFGGIAAQITAALFTWLTEIHIQTTGSVGSLYNFTSGMSVALISVVLVFSMATFYLSGLSPSGSGGFEALEGIARTTGAVFFIMAWPYFFRHIIGLANAASEAVLQNPALKAQIAHLLTGLIFVHFTPAAPAGLIIDIIVAIAGVLLFLGLMFLKVMLGATLTFLFIAMPLAIVVWPVSALSWITRAALGTFFSLIIIPFIWTLVFATFAAVSSNAAFGFEGSNPVDIFLQKITEGMVAIAMLALTLTVPRALLRMATGGMIARGPGIGSRVASTAGRIGTYVAARQAQSFVSSKLGGGGSGAPKGKQTNSQRNTSTSQQKTIGPAGSANGGGGGESPAEIDTRRKAAAAARNAAAAAGAAGTGAGAATGVAGAASGAAGAAAGTAAAAAAARAATGGAGARPATGQPAPAGAVGAPAAGGAAAGVARGAAAAGAAGAGAGRVQAVGPSVGATRPAQDQPDMASQRPVGPTSSADTTPLAQAQIQAISGEAPTPTEARAAFASLGPDMQQRMAATYGSSGAAGVRNDLAFLSTSDAISNGQASSALTLASAAEHGQMEGLLGLPAVSPTLHESSAAIGPAAASPGWSGAGQPVSQARSGGATDSRASVRSDVLGGDGGGYAFHSQSSGAPPSGYSPGGGFNPPPAAAPNGGPQVTGRFDPPSPAPPSGPVVSPPPATPPSRSADVRDATLSDQGFRSQPREKS